MGSQTLWRLLGPADRAARARVRGANPSNGGSQRIVGPPSKKKPAVSRFVFLDGVPTGIRTPVASVKGKCPRPLDDGDAVSKHALSLYVGFRRNGSGGASRDRTDDLLHAMQALSQLSYSPRAVARSGTIRNWGLGCQAKNFRARAMPLRCGQLPRLNAPRCARDPPA